MNDFADSPYVSRAGLKLAAALDGFDLDPTGWVCADFGCNVGGFTDCLLRRGAAKVYAVDTGYGALAWTLRKDPRVTVMERTNALHAAAPERVDLVTIDVAWTPQRLILPAAGGWLKPDGRVVSLLKPHYEASAAAPKGGRGRHVLTDDEADAQRRTTCEQIAAAGWSVAAAIDSPVVGGKGNREYLLLLRPPGAFDGARAPIP